MTKSVATRRASEIREAAFVAVEIAEIAEAEALEIARRIALRRRLDLDDFRAEISKDHPAGRSHHGMAEIEHANPAAGKVFVRHRRARKSTRLTSSHSFASRIPSSPS